MKTLAIAAVLFALPGAALAADKFDLYCKGTNTDARGVTSEWTEQYSIDLTAGRWCAGTCGQVKGVVRFDAGEIVLTDRDDRPAGRWVEKLTVNRSTGLVRHLSPYFDWDRRGTCEPKPFSSIPETKF